MELLNAMVCHFSLSFVIANEESLGLGLLVGQKKQSEDGWFGLNQTFN